MSHRLVALCLCIACSASCRSAKENDPAGRSRADLLPRKIDSSEVNANFYQVGECYLAGQPTANGFREAKAKGVKTILNLKTPDEQKGFDEKALVESLSLKYAQVPVSSQTLNDQTADRFLETLRTAEKPILIHCGAADRVSGLWAIHLVVDEGLSLDEALALAGQSGLRSENLKTFAKGYLERKQKRS